MACVDASAWDEQHSSAALTNAINGIADVMSSARQDKAEIFREHAEALKECPLNRSISA